MHQNILRTRKSKFAESSERQMILRHLGSRSFSFSYSGARTNLLVANGWPKRAVLALKKGKMKTKAVRREHHNIGNIRHPNRRRICTNFMAATPMWRRQCLQVRSVLNDSRRVTQTLRLGILMFYSAQGKPWIVRHPPMLLNLRQLQNLVPKPEQLPNLGLTPLEKEGSQEVANRVQWTFRTEVTATMIPTLRSPQGFRQDGRHLHEHW